MDLNNNAIFLTDIKQRDLKPANIFLVGSKPQAYSDYPQPVLADFGLAFKTQTNDPCNPSMYNGGSGTKGFRAPEQRRWVDSATSQLIDEWALDSKTNVYGVGMILWCMVTLDSQPEEPLWLGRGDMDRTLVPLPVAFPANLYSVELRQLIGECLSFFPANRPTFREILTRVDQATGGGGPVDRSLGMRNSTAPYQARLAQRLRDAPDPYRLGLARINIPAGW